jgi:hypothetical protein
MKPAIKHFQKCGPKGLRADIGSLKGSVLTDMLLAKKFLFLSGRVGIY